MTPVWFGQGICLFGIWGQQVSNWGWLLSQLARHVKQIHLVIPLAHLVRQTARPRLDAVECVSVLIVASLAHIDLLVARQSSWPPFVVPCMKHHIAAVDNVIQDMVTILSRLHHFVLIEALRHAMHRLLWSVVPARIDPFLAGLVLPQTVNLRHNRLLEVIGVANVYPIA